MSSAPNAKRAAILAAIAISFLTLSTAGSNYSDSPLLTAFLQPDGSLGRVSSISAVGDLDPAFGAAGKVMTPFGTDAAYLYSIALQDDGKIVAAGYVSVHASNTEHSLSRVTTRMARWTRHSGAAAK